VPSEKNGEITKIRFGKSKVTITFGEGEIKINRDTYTEFRLYQGKVVTSDELEEIKKRDQLDKFLKSALASLSKGHPTTKMIIDKLKAKEATREQTEQVVSILTNSGLLDDETFLEDYLDYAENKGYGQMRIVDALYEKGVPRERIERLIFDEEDEVRRAESRLPALERKFARYNYHQRVQRIHDSLLRLGYSSSTIASALKKVDRGDEARESDALRRDYRATEKKYAGKGGRKVIDHLLAKGYRYADIIKIKQKDEQE